MDPDLSLGYCYNAGDDSEWLLLIMAQAQLMGDFFQGPAVPCTAEEISGEIVLEQQFGQTFNMKNLGLSGYNLFINSDPVFGDADDQMSFILHYKDLKLRTQLGPDITGAPVSETVQMVLVLTHMLVVKA